MKVVVQIQNLPILRDITVGNYLHVHVKNDTVYSFGFTGRGVFTFLESESPCTSLNGHLWEQQPMVLLSNPPQNVYRCVQEGCGCEPSCFAKASKASIDPRFRFLLTCLKECV